MSCGLPDVSHRVTLLQSYKVCQQAKLMPLLQMDVKKFWFSPGSSQASRSIRLGRSYTKPRDHRSYDGARTVWEILWRKLRRDKKNVYDPETYSKNFDQGTGSMEPDNLCRSFSSRFADPSRILPPKDLLDS